MLQLVNVCVFCQLESVFMLGHALWSSSEEPGAWLRGGEGNLGEGWSGGVGGVVLLNGSKNRTISSTQITPGCHWTSSQAVTPRA